MTAEVCIEEQAVVFQNVCELFGDDSSEKFASRVEEGNGAESFGDGIVRLAWLLKDHHSETAPWLVVYAMRKDCIEKRSEIWYKDACAFLKHNVAYAVWSRCLVTA
jgi:hypothetical protein